MTAPDGKILAVARRPYFEMKGFLRNVLHQNYLKFLYASAFYAKARNHLLGKGAKRPSFRAVFLVSTTNRGWILDAICQEIRNFIPFPTGKVYIPGKIPDSEHHFFSHFSLLPSALLKNPDLWTRKKYVWFTHPRECSLPSDTIVRTLHWCERIFTPSSLSQQYLLDMGVPASKISVVLGGADPDLFPGHQRSQGMVGLCGAYYERKSPHLILEIIRLCPHRNFLLVGKNWENFSDFSKLLACQNFRYVTPSAYQEYPALYAQMDVFLSASSLEGGPIPLLEAMMSNAVPVASNTGFASDLIEHGKNGYIFEIGASAAEIAQLIEQAYELKADVRSTVVQYSWENFSKEIQQGMHLLRPSQS